MPDLSPTVPCPDCQAPLPAGSLACPSCHRLMHAARLRELQSAAIAATHAHQWAQAAGFWREALDLLPPGTKQHQQISAEIDQLSRRISEQPALPPRTPPPAWKKGAAGLGGVALIFWKFKFVLLFLLTKAKFLILGLTKAGTLFSMLLSFGVYWAAWGWKFAAGLVLSIYIHEMGHVAALRYYGIKATAPMFIPGLGALIRLKQNLANEREDARVGLAGPLWGIGAVAIFGFLFLAFDNPACGAIAKIGAWINLFNLLPVWTLDGGRAFHAFDRRFRWIAAAAIGTAWFLTAEPLLALLLLAAVYQAFQRKTLASPDRLSLFTYCFLVFALAALARLPVAVP